MYKPITVSFFGHRIMDNGPRAMAFLRDLVETLITNCDQVDFLVGRDGDFDLIAASIVREMKKTIRDDNSTLIWVMPYVTAQYRKYEKDYLAYYDEIEVCPESETAHFKRAIRLRNQAMVDRSDLCLFYVEHPHGGAYQAFSYAQKKNVPRLNAYWEEQKGVKSSLEGVSKELSFLIDHLKDNAGQCGDGDEGHGGDLV